VRTLVVLLVITLVVLVLHIEIGAGHLTISNVLHELFGGIPGTPNHDIVWQIRLPRAIACVLVGASLGMVGERLPSALSKPPC
jgi:iron complex transport system permease protein